MSEPDPTYYERPVLKETVWRWYIPAYFVVGGVAGASATIAAAAQVAGRGGHRRLVERGRRTALAGIVLGTGLLVADLGRPARAANMLRVVRPTSPMSLGSWLLVLFGPAIGAAAVLPDRGRLGRLTRAAGVTAGLAGAPVAGYTGVLLATTAVPVWQGAGRSLPPLFVGSALAGAASLLELLPNDGADALVLRRCAAAGTAAELAAAAALERELAGTDAVVRPYRRGLAAGLWRSGQALSVLSLLGPVHRRRRARWTAAAGLTGSVLLKWAVFEAGRVSARDPRATFHQQRARVRPPPPG